MRSRELIPAELQMLEARSAGRTMELMVTDSDVVEQAKGFLREILDISVEDAYGCAGTPKSTVTNKSGCRDG